MRILYIFPHPDDESFGPALAMAQQREAGHEVSLLTLTRGGATKERHRLGYTVEEMGAVRLRELEAAARTLDLTQLTVLDFPDGGLAELDPREIEQAVSTQLNVIAPEIVVSYPVLGVSAFPDHLVTHAVVKRVFCEHGQRGREPVRRLAFFTLQPSSEPDRTFKLYPSSLDVIDVLLPVTDAHVVTARQALQCYETYQSVIEATRPLEHIGHVVAFELYRERFVPALDDLTAGLA